MEISQKNIIIIYIKKNNEIRSKQLLLYIINTFPSRKLKHVHVVFMKKVHLTLAVNVPTYGKIHIARTTKQLRLYDGGSVCSCMKRHTVARECQTNMSRKKCTCVEPNSERRELFLKFVFVYFVRLCCVELYTKLFSYV